MNPKDIQAQVARDLGIEALSPEEQEKVIAEFGAVAIQASTIAVLEAMAPEKREAFTKLLEAKDEAGAEALLQAEVPDHERIARQAVAGEIQRFRDFQKTV